MQNNSP